MNTKGKTNKDKGAKCTRHIGVITNVFIYNKDNNRRPGRKEIFKALIL